MCTAPAVKPGKKRKEKKKKNPFRNSTRNFFSDARKLDNFNFEYEESGRRKK